MKLIKLNTQLAPGNKKIVSYGVQLWHEMSCLTFTRTDTRMIESYFIFDDF